MIFLGALLLCGLLTALTLSGLVYLDATRRGRSPSTRLFGTLVVGFASMGGFLVPYVYTSELARLYFRVIKSRPIAASPIEFLAVSLVTGILISAGSALLYLVGSRVSYSRSSGETNA